MKNQYSEIIKRKTNKELLGAFDEKDDYRPEVISLIEKELKARGLNVAEEKKKATKKETEKKEGLKPNTGEEKSFMQTGSLGGFLAGFGGVITTLVWTGTMQVKWKTYMYLSFIPILHIYVALRLVGEGKELALKEGEWKNFKEFREKHKSTDSLMAIIVAVVIVILVFKN